MNSDGHLIIAHVELDQLAVANIWHLTPVRHGRKPGNCTWTRGNYVRRPKYVL